RLIHVHDNGTPAVLVPLRGSDRARGSWMVITDPAAAGSALARAGLPLLGGWAAAVGAAGLLGSAAARRLGRIAGARSARRLAAGAEGRFDDGDVLRTGDEIARADQAAAVVAERLQDRIRRLWSNAAEVRAVNPEPAIVDAVENLMREAPARLGPELVEQS